MDRSGLPVGAGYLREWGVKVFVLRGGGVKGWVVLRVKNRPGYAES